MTIHKFYSPQATMSGGGEQIPEAKIPHEILHWIHEEWVKNDCPGVFPVWRDSAIAMYRRMCSEIEKLRGILQEVCVRMSLVLPCDESLIDLFDKGIEGQNDLFIAIHEALFEDSDQWSTPKAWQAIHAPAEPAKEERLVVTVAEIKEIYADAVREFVTIPGGDEELADQINESFTEFIAGWKLKKNAGREG